MIILGIADKAGEDCAYTFLKNGDITATTNALSDIVFEKPDCIAYYKKPFLALERALETHMAHAPKGLQKFCNEMPQNIREAWGIKKTLTREIRSIWPEWDRKDLNRNILFSDEQLSLCAQAFYPTPYEEAAVLCIDDGGEWGCTSIALGQGSQLNIDKEITYPHSLGLFIDSFCAYLDMTREQFTALAQNGEPTYARMMMRNVVDLKGDGSYAINQGYFGYAAGADMTTETLHDLLGGAPRADEEINQRHRNIAASAMEIVQQAASQMVRAIARDYRGIHTLCIAGSIGRDALVRERILRDHSFDRVSFSALGGNKALASGAALVAYYIHHKHPRDTMFLQKSYNKVR